jgi:hypothetical protein
VEPGAGITFELTRNQGAALITKHPTYQEDIERELIFEDYTKNTINPGLTSHGNVATGGISDPSS